MTFYDSTYREIIASEITRNQQIKAYKKKLSEAGGFHPAYLSQILAGAAHLTVDQASLLCDFWEYDDRMSEFFIALVSVEKASAESLKKRLRHRLSELRTIVSQPERVVKTEHSLDYLQAQTVFSSSDFYAVLAAIRLPQIKSEGELSDFLKIHIAHVKCILKQLDDLQVIEPFDDFWRPRTDSHGLLVNNKSFTHDLVSSLHSKFSQAYINNYHSICYAAVIPLTNDNYNALKMEMRDLMQKYYSVPEDNGDCVAGLNLSLFRF